MPTFPSSIDATTARAVVIHAALDLRVEEVAVTPPGPGEVAVRIERGGICGSDLHYFNHGGFGVVRLKEPMILGHEVAGVVDNANSRIGPDNIAVLTAATTFGPATGHCAIPVKTGEFGLTFIAQGDKPASFGGFITGNGGVT